MKRSMAVSNAEKDRGMEKEAETGILSIEAKAICAIGTTSSALIRYPTLGGAVL